MNKKSNLLIVITLNLAVLGLLACGGKQITDINFDSDKWKADVTARYSIPRPVIKGMPRETVRELLGIPDAESKDEKSGFVYWMPNTSDPESGAYYVWFKDGVVSECLFDDSAYRPNILEDSQKIDTQGGGDVLSGPPGITTNPTKSGDILPGGPSRQKQGRSSCLQNPR